MAQHGKNDTTELACYLGMTLLTCKKGSEVNHKASRPLLQGGGDTTDRATCLTPAAIDCLDNGYGMRSIASQSVRTTPAAHAPRQS